MAQFSAVIHPTAIIHADARVDASCEVGPYAVIDAGVTLGAECRVGPHVYLTGQTTIGARNVFHAGCVIGDAPQDLKYQDAPTRLRIGNDNVFREHVTVNRSNKLEEDTVIGSHCFLMAHAHVAHNCRLGDAVILANDATLGGHVTVEDRAFLSANCLVHQFTRVGTLGLMRGGAAISKDLPPFCIAHQANALCGLNTVGLRRAGLSPAERIELRRVYHAVFRSVLPMRQAIVEAREQFTGTQTVRLLDFIAASQRGVLRHPAAHTPEDIEEESE